MSEYRLGENFKNNEEAHVQIQKANNDNKEKSNLLQQIRSLSKKQNSIGYVLDELSYQQIQGVCDNVDVMDIDFRKVITNEPKKKTVVEAEGKYTDKKVTAQTLRGLADWLCEHFHFIYIDGKALYLYGEGRYILFTYNFATNFLMRTFWDHQITYPLKSSDFKEIVRLLQAHPQILKKQEECKTDVTKILFADGVFEACGRGRLLKPHYTDYQFSKIDYPLCWDDERYPSADAREFVERFCDYDSLREDYFWELVGYLLSSYQQKIIVVLLGPSNSGKSTLANMVRRICGADACVAMGIKDLSASFNIAELQGKRLCVDSDMDSSALNAKDISLIKKVVGNDLMQGNRKYEQQFYFQCQTKFLLCTNNKIKIRSNEDSISLLNRMKVFELKSSIPQEEQIMDMDNVLDENRTYFLQQAMKGLLRLVSNNFQFSYDVSPEDYFENLSRQIDLVSVDKFVTVCCRFKDDATESVTDLYDAYKVFTTDNDYSPVSIKSFSCHLANVHGLFRGRSNKQRFFQGIKIVTDDE